MQSRDTLGSGVFVITGCVYVQLQGAESNILPENAVVRGPQKGGDNKIILNEVVDLDWLQILKGFPVQRVSKRGCPAWIGMAGMSFL